MSKRRSSAQTENSPGYQAKRAELMGLAAEVFKEKGFEAATLNDIAERFGTDRASIYYYFASKKELFQALFHDILIGVLNENVAVASEIAASDRSAPDKLRALVEQQLMSYEKHYPYVFLYIQEDMAKLSLENTAWARDMARKTKRFETIVTDVLQQGVDDGVLRADVSVTLMAKALFGMINWTHRWLKPGMRKTDARQTIDAFCAIFFDGAVKR
ncbi:TetR/AcrR family transcriptional regulator [Nocardiaceae bacterium YC2-7]|uniref:TetR/AcrR family transcriptional regulator n=2 Tax=Antrihabitans stalactiti TaxID=2584121 RepID=A0A848KKM5_9NOCA|nr:TetR/AcrR family transcriptional regulator [Antrihabitans stalactiti]NMN97524.1 TetR/AcrR family transcriptional regulator [Antrihabitans stalactiti]